MIRHVLKDGTTLKSIEGHTVKKADAPMLYEYLANRNKTERREKNGDHICRHKRV